MPPVSPIVVFAQRTHRSGPARVLAWVTAALLNLSMVMALIFVSMDNTAARDDLTKETRISTCLSDAYQRLADLVVDKNGAMYQVILNLSEPNPDRALLDEQIRTLQTDTEALNTEIAEHRAALASCSAG